MFKFVQLNKNFRNSKIVKMDWEEQVREDDLAAQAGDKWVLFFIKNNFKNSDIFRNKIK